MVATAAQLAANRANALRSTGPRSPEGKAASSRNALTHGAHATDDTILATTPNVYLDDFRARFQPADALEAHLVEHLAVLASRRDRLTAAMDALLELNERHALTECLHERYGVNTANGRIPGQPSWQAAMRRYDGNTYVDPRYPEPVSDPALDPDPILCSLAYTLSGPRAAALFRHEASVDRRFTATLKDLTALQAQRRAAAATEGKTAPAVPPQESGFLRAVDHYLRATATPTEPWFDPLAPAAASPATIEAAMDTIGGNATIGAAVGQIGGNDTTVSGHILVQAPLPDQSQSARPDRASSTHPEQYEANAPAGALSEQNEPDAAATPRYDRGMAISPTQPDRRIEPSVPPYLPEDEPIIFRSVLPRNPDEPSSIPAHWPGALLPGQ